MAEVIEVRRVVMGERSTIGEMYGPDGAFWCHTLEDPVRNIKIIGKTAIPAETYELAVTFSPKYQRVMPRLLSVPFYEGVLIHPGNTSEHTEGCLLVGKYDPSIADFVGHSRDTFDRIFPLIRKLTEKDEVLVKVVGGFEAQNFIREVPGAVPGRFSLGQA